MRALSTRLPNWIQGSVVAPGGNRQADVPATTAAPAVAPAMTPSAAAPAGRATDAFSKSNDPAPATLPTASALLASAGRLLKRGGAATSPPASPANGVTYTDDSDNPSLPTIQSMPFDAELGMERYIKDFHSAPQEPQQLHGLVFEEYPDGHIVTLKKAHQTTPTIPAAGPDIPSDAVKNNRVVLYVDGIHEEFGTQQDQIHRLLLAPRSNPEHGASVDQPVIGIHEAAGRNAGADGLRITFDLIWLKALQGKYLPTSWIHKVAYKTDGAVRSVYNEVRQSLEAGRDVQIVLHSGGGAETALALSLLSRDDGGKWKNAISQHVRVLAMAPAASPKDFELAGVKPESLFYTASKKDPVYRLASKYVSPLMQALLVARGAKVGLQLLFDRSTIPYHSPDYIFWRNVQPDGTQRIQSYLDGGPGGIHVLP